MQNERPILFFDGVCSLCNFFVDFILARDKGTFLIASLQGVTAQKLVASGKLDPTLLEAGFKTIVLYDNGIAYTQSRAVLRIIDHLQWPWKMVKICKIIPEQILDKIYQWVSQHRYQWFGKRHTCRLPTLEERERFLD